MPAPLSVDEISRSVRAMSETMQKVGGAIMHRGAAVTVFIAGAFFVGASMIKLEAVEPFADSLRYVGDSLCLLSGLRGLLAAR